MVMPDETGISRFVVEDQDIPRLRHALRLMSSKRISRVRVPRGCMYVLGDNASASIDSRDFGMVPITDVIGHVRDRSARTRVAQAAMVGAPALPSADAAARAFAPVAAGSAAARGARATRTAGL
jgi:hypothetical protein